MNDRRNKRKRESKRKSYTMEGKTERETKNRNNNRRKRKEEKIKKNQQAIGKEINTTSGLISWMTRTFPLKFSFDNIKEIKNDKGKQHPHRTSVHKQKTQKLTEGKSYFT
jgi:hypothetical protein